VDLHNGIQTAFGWRDDHLYSRYFKNKCDHVFTVEPASTARTTIDWVHRILEEERDIVISSRPLEAMAFQVENIRIAYVFYESGLSINVMYTVDDPKKRAVGSSSLKGWKSPRSSPRDSTSRRRSRSWPSHSRFLLRLRKRLLTAEPRFAPAHQSAIRNALPFPSHHENRA